MLISQSMPELLSNTLPVEIPNNVHISPVKARDMYLL